MLQKQYTNVQHLTKITKNLSNYFSNFAQQKYLHIKLIAK